MKKIIFLSFLTLFGEIVIGQTTIKTNFVISKTTPTISLNGAGGIINFNNDITLTHSPDILTLSGGTLSLGSNSLGLLGSIASTSARVFKGWFTDLEITNLPTINGGTLVSALPFASYVPYTGATGTVALGVNGITSTGTFGSSGARITKIWTTNIESTNLPTINGGTLKTALSLTSADVGLGNLTNKLQIELEDSVNYPNGYMSRFDGVTGLVSKLNISDTANMLTNYINKADTSTMLNKYARKASPIFTGTVTIPSPFTFGATSVTSSGDELNILDGVTASTAELNVLDGIPGTLTATELSYVDGAVSNIQQQLYDTIPARGYINMLSDTSLYFAPVIGLGNGGDTILFSLHDVIWGCKWDGSYSLVLTKINGVVYGTTPDIDIALWHDANFRDGTPTEILSSDLTITSTTTGNDATSFASATIAPGTFIWITVEQQTAQPTQCIISIYGHLTE